MIHTTQARWSIFVVLVVLLCFSVIYSGLLEGVQSRSKNAWFEGLGPARCSVSTHEEAAVDPWDPSLVLNGFPTPKFKDNLRNDTWYVTAWSNAGFTNQFMSYVNMIYLGRVSDRVPIIPPFGPDHHITPSAGALSFGHIFNLTYARHAMRRPLLEWKDVKALPSDTSIARVPPEQRERLGCWSGRQANDPNPSRVASVVDHLQLDIAYTRVPTEARRDNKERSEEFVEFDRLVPYIFPQHPYRPNPKGFPLLQASPLGSKLPPNERMSCFDHLYYATSSWQVFEWRYSWSPAWGRVAVHLRFTDELVDLTKGYLARSFNTTEDLIPPFIAVHMRRNDFASNCINNKRPVEECIPSVNVYKAKVDAIRQELLEKQNRDVGEILLMSDEIDPSFWQGVKAIGWKRLDHLNEQTKMKHGEWYPPIIDQVAGSMAAGFVGTEGSTFSLVGARRVEDWNNGYSAMIHRS